MFKARNNQNACVYGPPEYFQNRNGQQKNEQQQRIPIQIPEFLKKNESKSKKSSEPVAKESGPARIIIVGMGAMGMLYAERLNSVKPCNVTFLMDEDRYVKYRGRVFTVNSTEQRFKMITPRLYNAGRPADIVIVATKATALEAAMELMTCCVGDNTIIVSLLNGITSEQILGERFNPRNIIPCVAQGMDAVKFGDSLTYSSDGTLFLGKVDCTDPKVFSRLTEVFSEYGVHWTYAEDIMLRMWKKFMLNCGINQSCMVHQATYGTAVIPDTEPYNTFVDAMKEVQRLAAFEGYDISDEDISYYVELMATLNYDGMPSMAQDRINRRHSEVELFAGTVIRLAKKHGLDVPVNRWIYDRVAEIEAEY